eukprot:Gb_17659 [translate_table: standard]
MEVNEGKFIKILIFCALVLVMKSGLQPYKQGYDQHHVYPKAAALFVFGDSLADAGTNNYINTSAAARANFPPYGQTYFSLPTGRFSDGRTIFDFLANFLGLPFPAPFLQPGLDFSHGVNFASAGSGLLDSTFKQLNVISFGLQVNQFRNVSAILEKSYGYQAKYLLSASILAINVGVNDIAGNYLANTTLQKEVTPPVFLKSLLQTYKKHLMSLYEIGGRKFVLFGISPLGCSPGMRFSGFSTWKGECDQSANKLFMQFNSGLKNLVRDLNRGLNGSTILYVNNYDFLLNIIRNGKAFGFSDTVSACCGGGRFNAAVSCGQENPTKKLGDEYKGFVCKNPSEYVYWDGFHPTEKLQWMIANAVWGGDSSVVSPFNLTTLIQTTSSQPIPSFIQEVVIG